MGMVVIVLGRSVCVGAREYRGCIETFGKQVDGRCLIYGTMQHMKPKSSIFRAI